ncbi:MAG: radical SAM protein [Thermodesulfovibrionales bacterium]|nr:radical SAM protein [Thermodesulfovibrionales bacterium]
MKILCLNPPFKTEYGRFSRTSRSPAITKSGAIYYPIWLCYVAGVLEEAGHDVKVIDSCAYEYNLERTLQFVNDFRPEIAVLDTSTPSIYSDIKTGAEIKRLLPDCFVVLMGTHPSALPEETLRLNDGDIIPSNPPLEKGGIKGDVLEKGEIGRGFLEKGGIRVKNPQGEGIIEVRKGTSGSIDAVAVGEADYTIKELAQKLSEANMHRVQTDITYRDNILSSIDGLAYRNSNKICVNKKREFIKNLDELPFVSQVYKRHLDTRKYFFAASDYPEIQIMTARGCIARCTFCVYPQTIHGWKYRVRSPQNIADEFQWIVENMPEIREIGIEDDTFTGSQGRVVEFCKELIKRNIKIKWYCNVRVDLKYETMQWMRKAGCVLVTVGYESANREILKNINKKITPDMILEFSRNTRKADLLVHGCFMAGNRGESRETLDESLNLSLMMTDDTMQFFPLMVYPGTMDYEWARREGLLTIRDYSEYVTEDGCHNSTIRMNDMTEDEIRQWCDYARRKYYLRPRYILYKLAQQIRHPSEIRRTFKAAKRFVRFLMPV